MWLFVFLVGIPPSGVDFYIHRSGRTGRKGLSGKTILVYSPDDVKFDHNIHHFKKDVSEGGKSMHAIGEVQNAVSKQQSD